jgi:hypothetical protein
MGRSPKRDFCVFFADCKDLSHYRIFGMIYLKKLGLDLLTESSEVCY